VNGKHRHHHRRLPTIKFTAVLIASLPSFSFATATGTAIKEEHSLASVRQDVNESFLTEAA
jgi:hypothetical protein